MRLIGLTGRSGSGKSTVAACAAEMGIPVVDCDALYREVTSHPSECLRRIREAFGEQTVRDGKLDRPVLREIVFSDPQRMRELNCITAECLTAELEERLQHLGDRLVLLDAPTLFECGLDERCEQILCVLCSDQLSLQRIVRRDGISKEAAEARLAQQHDNCFFAEHCDVVLYNEGDRAQLYADARCVLETLFNCGRT